MAKKFYILGASGFMGGGCAAYLRAQGHTVITERVDITDRAALGAALAATKPDVVINFAGVRAYPNIDWCETHKLETVAVNVGGPINVAQAGIAAGAYVIQIASGCVYHGGPEHAFTETDAPNFFGSFYSRMRVAMQAALAELPVLQVRLRMPISRQAHDRNLITKIAHYQKVISLPNSVTLIEDMYPALELLAEQQPVGILNLTNDGWTDNATILAAYKEIVDPAHEYELIPLEQLPAIAERSNCVLDNTKAKGLGIVMPALDAARLAEVMRDYQQTLKN